MEKIYIDEKELLKKEGSLLLSKDFKIFSFKKCKNEYFELKYNDGIFNLEINQANCIDDICKSKEKNIILLGENIHFMTYEYLKFNLKKSDKNLIFVTHNHEQYQLLNMFRANREMQEKSQTIGYLNNYSFMKNGK